MPAGASGIRPQVLRFALGSAHYRSAIDYTEATLAEAAASYGRLETFVLNATDSLGGMAEAEASAFEAGSDEETWAAFGAAMDDDLSVPRALAVLFTAVADGNRLLSEDAERLQLARTLATVRRGLDVLGLEPLSQWPSATGDLTATVGSLVEIALEARSAARERRDFAQADAIRDRLAGAGILVEDTSGGARWRLGR